VEQAPNSPPATLTYPCGQCGARLEYAPGTTVLKCPYCGHEQPVTAVDEVIEEHDYVAWQSSPIKATAHLGTHVLTCRQCAATTQTDDLSTACPFCGAPIVADVDLAEQIAPEGVVPFGIDRGGAQASIRAWVGSRWFAPTRLRKVSATESLKGTYLPHWTFDAATTTRYSGLRGEHYWVTETYTTTVDGRAQTQTRQVMKTRWWPASGTVSRGFDDVVVVATRRLSPERITELAPWPLAGAAPYQPEYLSGYQTPRYEVEPDEGLESAKQQMRAVIREDCRADIGGDEQQVHSMDTRYGDLMFKLMLLPVWLAVYLYAGKSFQVFVNAHTGQVVGERPYSAVKIAFAVLAALIVIAIVVTLIVLNRNQSAQSAYG
jgi:Zn finger protein HypA/HybF involved in hydrogenase expression